MQPIEYEIKRYKRSRSIRISVKPGGRVVVSMPWRAPQYLAKQFVEKQAAWILEAQKKMLAVSPSIRGGTKGEYEKYKKEALKVLSARLSELNQFYNFPYKRVSIRNQKTRWGSYSKSGTISLSYRLLFLPPEVRDYVLVHELCHIAELNHSRKFWALVAQLIPNYRVLRSQLRQQN